MNKLILGILSVLLVFLVACAPAPEVEAEPTVEEVAPEVEAEPTVEEVAPEVEVAEPEETVEVAPTEVTFGWIGPLTGSLSTLGVPIMESVKLAVEEINANNVIPGKTLKIIYEDDACEPKDSTTAVQKLVNVDKVTAIVGPTCSGPMLADAPILEENKVLAVSFSATNPSIKDAGDYIFRNVPSDNGQGVAAAEIVQGLGATKVAIIHIQNDWGVALKNVFTAKAEELGMEIVAVEPYNPDETDFRTPVTKIKASNPDVIYMPAFTTDAVLLLKQLDQAGLEVPLVGADGSKDDAVIAGAGAAAEGLIVTLPGVPKSPELETFAAAFQAKYSKEYSAYTSEAYDVTYILAKACAATDCTSTAMKDYLYTMGPYKGASGTYEFDQDGEVDKPYDYFVIKDGKWAEYITQ